MKWFDSFINRPIVKILRIDSEEDYDFFEPFALFIMFDESNGLLLGAFNDGNSIQIESSTLNNVSEDYGIDYSERILNELKAEDELNHFIGQTIKTIKVGEFISDEIRSESFIIKQGKYAGIVIESDRNKFIYYNESGGHLFVDEDLEFPNPQRWSMQQNGS
jgi:hypothetical protein